VVARINKLPEIQMVHVKRGVELPAEENVETLWTEYRFAVNYGVCKTSWTSDPMPGSQNSRNENDFVGYYLPTWLQKLENTF